LDVRTESECSLKRVYLIRYKVKVIVGNKVDLEESKEISYEEIQKYAKDENALFVYTSAKNGKGIEDLFNSIA